MSFQGLPLVLRIPLTSHSHFPFTHPCRRAPSLRFVCPPISTSFTSRQRFGSPSNSDLSAVVSVPLAASSSSPIPHRWQQRPRVAATTAVGSHCTVYSQQRHLVHSFLGERPPARRPRTDLGSRHHSPTTSRPSPQPLQGPYYSQQMQRRTADTLTPDLNDLGKGIPLSFVFAS